MLVHVNCLSVSFHSQMFLFVGLYSWCCDASEHEAPHNFFDLCIFDRKFGQALVKVRNSDLLQCALNFTFKDINFSLDLKILISEVFCLGFNFLQWDGNLSEPAVPNMFCSKNTYMYPCNGMLC